MTETAGLVGDLGAAASKDHGLGETAAEIAGEKVGGKVAERTVATPLDTVINLVNDVVTAVGPKEASAVTGGVADITPSKFMGNMFSQGLRALYTTPSTTKRSTGRGGGFPRRRRRTHATVWHGDRPLSPARVG